MNATINIVRVFFFLVSILAGYLVVYAVPEWERYSLLGMVLAALVALLVILVDILLKGFSLRGVTALTFGILFGWAVAHFLSISPIFEHGDPAILYLSRIALFMITTYLVTVVALRGKDEFHLIVPFVRFVPHGVQVPLVVVDTSALIDGRILGICQARFMGFSLVIPRFVLEELQRVADSNDVSRQARGRRGLEVLNQLKLVPGLDLRVHESDLIKGQTVDAKLIFLAQSLRARLLTTDFNLAQLAEFHGVEWLNLNQLARALAQDVAVGDQLEVELVKVGREVGQAVGYLGDGSMVVVNDGRRWLGQRVRLEVQSVLPSAGGKMIFAKTIGEQRATSTSEGS